MSTREEDPTVPLLTQVTFDALVSPTIQIVVTEGPDAGTAFRIEDLSHRRVFIGKSPVCEVLLTDRAVSRRHAALEIEDGALRISDLDSSNGTLVGSTRVKDAYVQSGDTVRVGSTALRVDFDGTPHPVAAANEARFEKLIGASPEMRRLYPMLARLAMSQVPVLIEGETGTGKEVVAESLHEAGPRRARPFVVFDCTTISASMLEAELFGHERGAFTGAIAARPGVFEQAHGGTLFIDEIGELDLALQAKLLRAIERSEVRRVGGNQWAKVDVRILAATRRDLDREVQARRFRDDLFYRLAVARIELPPLRKRRGDVALLAACFWRMLGGDHAMLPPEVLQRFEAHDWPGNVRELHNAVARQIAMGEVTLGNRSAALPWAAEDGTDFIDHLVEQGLPFSRGRQEATAEYDRRYVKRMLALHGDDVGAAAAASGIGRRYFQKLRTKV